MTQIEHAKIVLPTSPAALHLQPCDVLVLDAGLRQSLVTVRSLGSRGLRVAALEIAHKVPAFSSRWCQQQIICPAEEGTEQYLEYVEQVLDATKARVLITSSDGTVALLRQHRERLEQRVRVALASEPGMGIAVNKDQTLEIAQKLGLAIPRGISLSSVNEVDAALREIGLPAVIKPVESWVENTEGQERARILAQLATTPDEARRAVEELTALGGSVLFQKFLTGRREGVHLLYANGQVYGRFAQWAKRTDPPLGGSSVLRQSIAIPEDIGEPSERLIREINLEGYSEVEFRRDGDGTPYLMEINPRLSASIEMAVRSGVDFPYLIYQWASGEPINEVKSYHVGGWMRYLGGDIATTAAAIEQRGRPGVAPPLRTVLDFCASFFVPMGYDYFNWRDPKPAWVASAGFTQLLLKWMGRNIAKPFRKKQTASTLVK
ncbi:MAG TPA: ATP-grasp domain-containing protein [Ktedonobacteraceae bacterium]|nr:ATP-grasp domain-containing protein [Ktedonobacteraceae bacterium]